jgi:hypothetical protein
MKYLFASLGIAVLATVLAGCSWFVKENPANDVGNVAGNSTQNLTNTSADTSSATSSNITPQNIESAPIHASGTVLSRQDHGFEITYPENVAVNETTACAEGCPEGESKPAFSFDIASSGSTKLVVYKNQKEFLKFLDPAEDFASFIKTDVPMNTSSRKMNGGTRYDFVILGLSGQPGLYSPEGFPEMQYIAFVRNDGKTFVMSAGTHDAIPYQTMRDMAPSFKFI